MGAAIDAFGVMVDAVKRNPLLFAGAGVIGIASTVLNTSGQVPLLGLVVGLLYFFVEPFFAGGYLGMANSAVDGEATFGDFLSSGKENFGDLLVARLVVAVPFIVYAIVVVTLVGIFAFGASMGLGGAGSLGFDPTAALAAAGIVGLVVFGGAFVLFAVPFVLLQFYPAAIVIGGADALDSFKYSFELVKANPLSALGYTAFAFVLGLVLVVPGVLGGGGQVVGRLLGESAVGTDGGIVTGFVGGLVVFGLSFVVLKTLVVFVVRTYYVSFVRSVTGTA